MTTMRLLWSYGVLLTLWVACGQSPTVNGQELISWQQYEELTKASTTIQIVDVRTPEEFAAGNRAGAVNMDYYAEDFKTQLQGLDKERPVIVYCKRGGRSHKAAVQCKELGFKTVYDVEGGFDQWQATKKATTNN